MSCQDNIDIEQLGGKSKLVLYAFPTNSDTIKIHVSLSAPLTKAMPSLEQVSVRCTTNGNEDQMVFVGDTLYEGFPIATYYAIGKHQCGDSIYIYAQAKELDAVYASTQIPSETSITSAALDTVYYKGNLCSQIKISFPNDMHQTYYAIRILGRSVTEDDVPQQYEFMEIETGAEPLLNYNTSISIDFGTWNNFYHNMYIFKNTTVSTPYINLHLDVLQQNYIEAYKPQIFLLSESYYLLLKSFNDIANNELANHGLSFAFATYSNVKDGYGSIAGYTCKEGDWLK